MPAAISCEIKYSLGSLTGVFPELCESSQITVHQAFCTTPISYIPRPKGSRYSKACAVGCHRNIVYFLLIYQELKRHTVVPIFLWYEVCSRKVERFEKWRNYSFDMIFCKILKQYLNTKNIGNLLLFMF